MGEAEHKEKSPDHVRCYVLGVSDTRTEENDFSGQLVKELLKDNFHKVVGYSILKDDKAKIKTAVKKLAADDRVEVILLTGGTGISPRDVTVEAIEEIFDKKIDGFGQVFRSLSYAEVGPAAILSRATAGVIQRKVVVAMPGALEAVRLAMNDILLPELGHMVFEAGKGS
ncbi:MAG: molybdenum cofactor biosynthesis protein MoaB [Acidobacteriota bacterium]|nr:MAG: molybdenum cofactor biosynthesis protein MoaB [Acidobacteriota bacterium]